MVIRSKSCCTERQFARANPQMKRLSGQLSYVVGEIPSKGAGYLPLAAWLKFGIGIVSWLLEVHYATSHVDLRFFDEYGLQSTRSAPSSLRGLFK